MVGDGHCLLHAFAMSLEDEKITVSSIEDLCSKLKNEIEQHPTFDRPFSTNESLIEDIDSYIKSNQIKSIQHEYSRFGFVCLV